MQCPACGVDVEVGDFAVNGFVEGSLEIVFEHGAPECACVRYVYVTQEQLNRTSDRKEGSDGAGDTDGADNPWSSVAAPGEDEV